MFTEQQIEKAFGRANEISNDDLVADFQKMIKKQKDAIGFVIANAEQYKFEENTKHATIELLYYIFQLYKNSNSDQELTEASIAQAMRQMDSSATDIEKEIGGMSKSDIDALNKAIEKGDADKLTGKPKEILDVILNKKKSVSQPLLLEVVSMNITKDNMIAEKEKSIVFSIAETIIDAIQIQAKESF